jgi:hypothetical protein
VVFGVLEAAPAFGMQFCVDLPKSIAPLGVKEYVIYFGNGVDTPIDDAYNRGEELIAFVEAQATFPANSCVSFGVSYNPTGGLLRDAVEASAELLTQPGGLGISEFWRWLGGLIVKADFLDILNNIIVPLLKGALGGLIDNPTIDEQKEHYVIAVAQCKNVLLVAHSQGNWYGNSAFSRAQTPPDLIHRDHWRMVSVATPANSVASPAGSIERWATSSTDRVIAIVPGHKEANTNWGSDDISNSIDPWLGHAFTGYLLYDPNTTKHLIKTHIQGAIEELLPSGCVRFSDPAYTATATATTAIIKIQRTGGNSNIEYVQLDTNDGTAHAGIDYVARHEVLPIPAGQTEIFVPIELINNPSVGSRTVNLVLSIPGVSGTQLTTPTIATLTIQSVDSANCPDPFPNITASATAIAGITQQRLDWAQPGPVQLNADVGAAGGSAQGVKGNVSVHGFSDGTTAPAKGSGTLHYKETFIVRSPGKTGGSIATLSVSASTVTGNDDACDSHPGPSIDPNDPNQIFAEAVITSPLISTLQFTASHRCGGNPYIETNTGNTADISFSYGAPTSFDVSLSAYGITQTQPVLPFSQLVDGSASVSYSVKVPNDPNARVTFCRATP